MTMWAWTYIAVCACIIRVEVYNEVLPQECGDCLFDTGQGFIQINSWYRVPQLYNLIEVIVPEG